MKNFKAVAFAREPTIGPSILSFRQNAGSSSHFRFGLFETLPSEIRNRIYKILLKHKGSIYNARQLGRVLNFAEVLKLKQISSFTAKQSATTTPQYLCRRNQLPRQRYLPLLNALSAFVIAVPKPCLEFFTWIPMDICAACIILRDFDAEYVHGNSQTQELSELCRVICKNLPNINRITTRACESDEDSGISVLSMMTALDTLSHGGCFKDIAQAVKFLFDGGDGFEGLTGVKRLACLQMENLNWLRNCNTQHTLFIHGRGDIPTGIEGNRADLKDENGVYKLLMVSETDVEVFYETVGAA